ncbi:MAG: protein phosphatase 2C domain-containing protein [Actinomycetota bacterium]
MSSRPAAPAVADFAAKSDVGRARKLNEDAFFTGKNVFAVADGLGGHRAGEVASKMAVDLLAKLDATRPEDPPSALVETIIRANQSVHDRAASDPETTGMATTVTALLFDGSVAHLGHVGDSRCYLLRGGAMTQVSKDHTLVAHMIAEGALTPAQAEHHPQRSVVTRALGADDGVSVDTGVLQVQGGDRILLCTDGLSSVVPESEIEQILLNDAGLDELCDRLISNANARGGPDNITVVLLDVADSVAADGSAFSLSTQTISSSPDPGAVDTSARSAQTSATTYREPVDRPSPRRARRRIPLRPIVWLVLLIGVVFGGLTGVKAWANRSWYVGVQGKRVTIYRGLPTDFIVPLHHVQEPTTLTTDQVAPYYRERLKQGIRASSLKEARKLVEQAPRAVSIPPLQTGAPSPLPTVGASR